MAKQIVNGVEYSNEFDPQIYAKIGTSPLQTQADNLSDAVNEINSSLSYKTISNLVSIKSAFSSIFEISNQSAYKVGNIVYFYLELHRVGTITVGEHDIAQVSVTPKIPCTAIPFSNDFSMLVQTSKNVKLSTNSTGRAWYTLTGLILVD